MGSPCPCGSGLPYDACCGPLHRGVRRAGTALELMRSRYAAYAVGDAGYVFRTWHPRTRPAEPALEGGPTWVGLTVEGYGEDWVEFTAHWRQDGRSGRLHERSRFARRAGRWLYLDGEIS
ncbi:YchJ family metal-binding protein [Nocardioides sp. BP30]|uniref:YchJ family protein n=1 Tax=Nocardioides sp. BP30 TaxID=3036374 RepID=UPI002468ABFE|nr:YchJ family metal-binding protein [Nocardioides sp. BP30]WGL54171.1 YchJ family metal-binding protein [Nocardioides sp. BP30]